MRLPEELRQRLSGEFHYAARRMEAAPGLPSKLYFFSVFFAEAGRILNLAWDDDVALVHMVCQATHGQINARLQLATSGADTVVGIPKDLPVALGQIASDLADLFDTPTLDKAVLEEVLARLSAIAFATTGNGGYLFMKGDLKISTSPTVTERPAAQSTGVPPVSASPPAPSHPSGRQVVRR